MDEAEGHVTAMRHHRSVVIAGDNHFDPSVFLAASFGLISFGFLTLLIWGLEGLRRRVLVPALITAAIAAFGAEYLFTNVFVVDLPT